MTPADSETTVPAKSGIVIIGGFLGSGKTTLLKRLLDWEFARATRPQVIMSEFGDFDIDGAIISDKRIDLTAVVGGCVCCGSKDELADALRGLISHAPGSPVYIEATGVADPAGVLAAIAPVLNEGAAFIRKVVVIYDASLIQLAATSDEATGDNSTTITPITLTPSSVAADASVVHSLLKVTDQPIGGLTDGTTESREGGVPILITLPLIKRLFSTKTERELRAHQVFIVSTTIVLPTEVEAKMSAW